MFDMTPLKKRIIESYEKNNLLADKVNLDKACKYVENPLFEEFRNEVMKHKTGIFHEKDTEEDAVEELADLEEVVKSEDDEVSIDIDVLSKIDHKVLTILHYLNLNLYKKHELKNLIVNDMLDGMMEMGLDEATLLKIVNTIPNRLSKERFLYEVNAINDPDLKLFFIRCYPFDKYDLRFRTINPALVSSEKLKLWCILNKITWYVEKHIDYEFRENDRRKIQIKKDLLVSLIQRIKPDLEKKMKSHADNRMKNISKKQVNRFIHYMSNYYDDQFIKVDKFEKKLNNDDYLFLVSKIRQYIVDRYRKTFGDQDEK